MRIVRSISAAIFMALALGTDAVAAPQAAQSGSSQGWGGSTPPPAAAGTQSGWGTAPAPKTDTPKPAPATDKKDPKAAPAKDAAAKDPAAKDPAAKDPVTAPAASTEQDRQIADLQRATLQQQAALESLQKLLETIATRLSALTPAPAPAPQSTPTSAPALPSAPVANTTSVPPAGSAHSAATPPAPAPAPPSKDAPRASPPPPPPPVLTIRLGEADFLLGGFMDATMVARSTNPGTGLGTSFGSIPFSNSAAGSLSETRLSAQNSRVTLGVTSKVGGAAVKSYLEADFLGQGPTSQFVTSNSATLRLRLYWVQAIAGKFEFLGGQSWSFLTPNRNGLSPVPGDLFFSQNVDTNYQAGLTWGRTNQFRFVFHPSKIVTTGVSVENPEQYVGSAATLPSAFSGAEVDNGSNTATPNLFPDVIAKLAFDPKTGKTHQHFEVGEVVRGFKTYDMPGTKAFTAIATGTLVAANVEPVKNLHVVATVFLSSGGGRYIANTNIPDFVVASDSSLSLVKSRSVIAGVEDQVAPHTLFYSYYSEARADANTSIDTNGKTIGYGVAGAASQNRRIQEVTAGVTQVFFKDAKIGALQLMAQSWYLRRTPFSVVTGAPALASAHMVWTGIRYVLP